MAARAPGAGRRPPRGSPVPGLAAAVPSATGAGRTVAARGSMRRVACSGATDRGRRRHRQKADIRHRKGVFRCVRLRDALVRTDLGRVRIRRSAPTVTCRAVCTTPPRPGSRPSRSRGSSKAQRVERPDFRTRAILIKEQRAELVKHHLWVLWTDYFKPPHFEKYPNLHQLFNEATKLAGASGAKGTLDERSPTSSSARSTRSPRSSGRPSRPDTAAAARGGCGIAAPAPRRAETAGFGRR